MEREQRMITIDVHVVNAYADGVERLVDEVDLALPMPPTVDDKDALDEWANEHLYPLTGTGRFGVEACHEVIVTRSPQDVLTGWRWSWEG